MKEVLKLDRLKKLQTIFKTEGIDAILISDPNNRRYFSGFTGSDGMLVISPDQAWIITDFRYWEQVYQQVSGLTLIKQEQDIWESIADLLRKQAFKKIGIEADNLSYADYRRLQGLLEKASLVPLDDAVRQIRWVKESGEIELLAKAAEITDLAWQKTLEIIKPGIQERDVALEFDYQLRVNGAEGSAFTTIVASGARAALPHAEASTKPIASGEWVLLDGGALYQGYHADMTRTVIIGKADDQQRKIYHLVLQAQMLALEGLKAGMIGKEIDAIARNFLTRAGYGDKFGHGLGHSVGLEIHEEPRLSVSGNHPIPVGAAVTVEPGIYLPGWGGVRIEDLVIVESDGLRNLTHSPKMELLEI